jgi:Flp pilus assembly protein TadD
MGKYEDALATARSCTRAVPASWLCHHELASELVASGKAPEALQEVLQADRLNPGVISVQSTLCVVRATLGDMDAARKACESAIALGSAGSGDRFNLAKVYRMQGQYEPALRQARIAQKMGHPEAEGLAKDIEKKLGGR